jgi:large subunit ribosomal protein L30e
MAEIEKSFKTIVKKGSVVFGKKQTKTSIDSGKAKLVVLADNCPDVEEITLYAKEKKIPVYKSKVNNVEIGYLCGKAYAVSTFAILEDGGVKLPHLMNKR